MRRWAPDEGAEYTQSRRHPQSLPGAHPPLTTGDQTPATGASRLACQECQALVIRCSQARQRSALAAGQRHHPGEHLAQYRRDVLTTESLRLLHHCQRHARLAAVVNRLVDDAPGV